HERLARACPGHEEERPVDVHDGLPLGGVQVAKKLLFEGISRRKVWSIDQRVRHGPIISAARDARTCRHARTLSSGPIAWQSDPGEGVGDARDTGVTRL